MKTTALRFRSRPNVSGYFFNLQLFLYGFKIFLVHTLSIFVADLLFSTLESGFKTIRKPYPERKRCGFKNIRIRVHGALEFPPPPHPGVLQNCGRDVIAFSRSSRTHLNFVSAYLQPREIESTFFVKSANWPPL